MGSGAGRDRRAQRGRGALAGIAGQPGPRAHEGPGHLGGRGGRRPCARRCRGHPGLDAAARRPAGAGHHADRRTRRPATSRQPWRGCRSSSRSGGAPITTGQIGQLWSSPTRRPRSSATTAQRTLTVTGSVVGRSLGRRRPPTSRRPSATGDPGPGRTTRCTQARQAQQQQKSFGSLISALLLSIVLIYMLMVGAVRVVHAAAGDHVLAAGGAWWARSAGCCLTGNTLNIFSMLGIIMLMGLVTKNAILLVDFTDILRKQGYAAARGAGGGGPAAAAAHPDDHGGAGVRHDPVRAEAGGRRRVARAAGRGRSSAASSRPRC